MLVMPGVAIRVPPASRRLAATAAPSADASVTGAPLLLSTLVAASDPSGMVSSTKITVPESGIYLATFELRVTGTLTWLQFGATWFDPAGATLLASWRNDLSKIGTTIYTTGSFARYLPQGGWVRYQAYADGITNMIASETRVSLARIG